MLKLVQIINSYSHPDIIIKASVGRNGLSVSARYGDNESTQEVSLEVLSGLGAEQTNEYVDSLVELTVAKVAIYNINKPRRKND